MTPRVCALGGGHGLAAALRAIRGFTEDVTAVVSVADDGGSSGRLVSALGVPPPGDARRCLLALAPQSHLADLFAYRFPRGELAGHSLGNLVLAALADEQGGFAEALVAAGAMLGAVGRVLPAAIDPVKLVADVGDTVVEGQSVLTGTPGIHRVRLDPPDVRTHPDVPEAIAAADLVVVGPGSLFTSILPVLAVPGIREALQATSARRVFVCNLTEQQGETTGMDAAAHLGALVDNAGAAWIDVMLVNDGPVPVGTRLEAPAGDELSGVPVVAAHVAADRGAVHDAERLAAAFQRLIP